MNDVNAGVKSEDYMSSAPVSSYLLTHTVNADISQLNAADNSQLNHPKTPPEHDDVTESNIVEPL